jgi:leucyl aminopeptidase
MTPAALRGLAEGAALASYRFRLAADKNGSAPKLRRVTVGSSLADDVVDATLAEAAAITDAVVLARDLTNTPSAQKSPRWFAERVAAAATRRPGISLKVFEHSDLEQGGFGGILAVGSGSPRPPVLIELTWRPPTRRGTPKPAHVVIAGKGITFDTGGISIKSLDAMSLMRKDMAGAAVACATVMAAADLGLPVRVTALAPLAETLISGGAYRPGDVVRQYGGITTEVHNTDAEGRVVLADALAYAIRRLSPDTIIDLATLTGAARIALGKKTAAVFGDNDELVAALVQAGRNVGEAMWRLPLAEDYAGAVAGDVADLNNSPAGGAGSITAALFLREFVGHARDRWAHIDMSAPSWSDSADGLLGKGATGWGVRTMVRWLSSY